jgi:hypothetical protein
MDIHAHIENTKQAIALISTVPPGRIVGELVQWRGENILRDIASKIGLHSCGTAFCLGGWLPNSQHFKNLGVVASKTGVPMMMLENGETIKGYHVAEHLFGRVRDQKYTGYIYNGGYSGHSLFAPTSDYEDARFNNEKEVVMFRLNSHLQYLEQEVQANENLRHERAAKAAVEKIVSSVTSI